MSFNRNRILKAFILSLVDAGITAFVETGTQWGLSCLWLTEQRPKLPIYTCEINPRAIAVAKKAFEGHGQIHMSELPSKEFLGRVASLVGDLPLFYLDAHGYKGFPILDELHVVGADYDRACIIIHDFQVPGIPEFGYIRSLNADYIRSTLSPHNKYTLFYPVRYVPHAGLQGWAVLFQNTSPLGDVSDLKEGEL